MTDQVAALALPYAGSRGRESKSMPSTITSTARVPKTGNARPSCPRCSRKMTVKQVSPVLFASNIDDVIYGCEDCSTTVKRTVKRN